MSDEMYSSRIIIRTMLLLFLGEKCLHVHAQTFADKQRLYSDLFSNYSTNIPPLANQGSLLHIDVTFTPVALARMDEIHQKFIVNGFMSLSWVDEFLRWNPSDYGGLMVIHPLVTQIYRPRITLENTMNDRDIFGDSNAPLSVSFNGTVIYVPGATFTALCKMDMEKFPFDNQRCSLKFLPMNFGVFHFVPIGIKQVNYIPNGEWEMVQITLTETDVMYSTFVGQRLVITFDLARYSDFFVVNLLIPIIVIGTLNIFGFFIPNDSGEKIGYSVTILLSLSVYMSIVGEILPSVSEPMPLISYFLLISFILSGLTVLDTMAIVWLHHQDEKLQQSDILFYIQKLVTKRKDRVSSSRNESQTDLRTTTISSTLTPNAIVVRQGTGINWTEPSTKAGNSRLFHVKSMADYHHDSTMTNKDTSLGHINFRDPSDGKDICKRFAAYINNRSLVLFSVTYFISLMYYLISVNT